MYGCMASAEKVWSMPSPSSPVPRPKKEKKDSFGYGCSMLGSGDMSVYRKMADEFLPSFFLGKKEM